jgi:type IV secretion system protein VirB10
MSLFPRARSNAEQSGSVPEHPGGTESGSPEHSEASIAGDRGIPSIHRARSVQSRASSLLAITLMTTLGVALLTWYYAKALNRPRQAQHLAQAAVRNRAQGEMPLPSLGRIESPFARKDTAAEPPPAPEPSTAEGLLGPPPGLPESTPVAVSAYSGPPPGAGGTAPQKPPGELAFERRLAGPAFAHESKDEGGAGPAVGAAQGLDLASLTASHAQSAREGADSTMTALLRPTVTPAVAASVLPTRRFLLAKGAFIDCTLETAVDSTLPGMTTCVTATDTFSADGSVVLLERGTKLVGETHGQVQQGAARLFVLWTEARTPTGVIVPLSSPGTDELGRSGLAGEVNRHFWDRFGAAILMTVINGAVQGAVNSQNSSGSVVVSPSTSTDVMTEVLRTTVSIPPTITKAQGDRIQVFVARDVDFRTVYALRMANAGARSDGAP